MIESYHREMILNKLNKVFTGFAFGTLFASHVFAGSLGATYTDSSVVSLEVVDRVQITNVWFLAIEDTTKISHLLSGTSQDLILEWQSLRKSSTFISRIGFLN